MVFKPTSKYEKSLMSSSPNLVLIIILDRLISTFPDDIVSR